MYNILICDDEQDVVNALKIYLSGGDYCLFEAHNGREALEAVEKNDIHLILMDIMMPQLDGIAATAKLREKSNVPIIILSAAQLDSDKILGLNLGADDYMVKPFNPLELIARINANLRRFYKLGNVQEEDDGKITIGELTLDTNTLTLEKNGVPVNLTATEHKILLMLMKSPGRVFTKMQIYEEVNGDYYANDDNTMMVHISNLRDKIEDDPKNPRYIKTLRGLGYKVEKQ